MSDKAVDAAAETLAKTYLDEVTGEQVSKTELKKRQKQRDLAAKKVLIKPSRDMLMKRKAF